MYQEHEEHGRHERREEDCGCGGHHEGGYEHGFGHRHHHGCCCCCGMRRGYGMGFGIGMHREGMPGFGMGMGMGHGFRRFISRDEVISRLEEYLKELQSEAKAVEERIAEIKKGGERHD